MSALREMKKRATDKMYAQVEHKELMCRMLEAAQEMTRPAGATAAEALGFLDLDSYAWLDRQATAAILYFAECLNKSEKPS